MFQFTFYRVAVLLLVAGVLFTKVKAGATERDLPCSTNSQGEPLMYCDRQTEYCDSTLEKCESCVRPCRKQILLGSDQDRKKECFTQCPGYIQSEFITELESKKNCAPQASGETTHSLAPRQLSGAEMAEKCTCCERLVIIEWLCLACGVLCLILLIFLVWKLVFRRRTQLPCQSQKIFTHPTGPEGVDDYPGSPFLPDVRPATAVNGINPTVPLQLHVSEEGHRIGSPMSKSAGSSSGFAENSSHRSSVSEGRGNDEHMLLHNQNGTMLKEFTGRCCQQENTPVKTTCI